MAQKLVLENVEEVSDQTGQNWNKWDENENRFEANELKWIGDYVVRSLIFIRTDLQIEDAEKTSHIIQILWKTLDLLN